VVNPRPLVFEGPLAILIDPLSASTSEIFAGGMKDLGRARIFGERSAGLALPSNFQKLPNGDVMQYAFANYVSASGVPLESRGVEPHVDAPPNREALIKGRDNALNAAMEWIELERGKSNAKAA
jgi:carboxyl-terminal processing protease